jgi:hypothetical protein
MTRYALLLAMVVAVVVAAGCDSTSSSSSTTEKPAAPVNTQTATTPTKEGNVPKNKPPVETRVPKTRRDL